jgi:carbonic anhydrase/acetyltransferase-like protein (isoleucine patch superfamily)
VTDRRDVPSTCASGLHLNNLPMIDPSAFIHETAVVIGDVHLGARASVWPTAVLRGDVDRIEVGEDSNVQDGAVLHCEEGIPCIVGKRVTIGHRAIVHGALVQDDVLIGMGAVVLNKVVVGRGSLIGAGAVVSEGTVIPPDSLVLGVPAKVVRTLNPEQRARLAEGHVSYVAMRERHRTGEFPRHR